MEPFDKYTSDKCYGWVPTLTGYIFLDKHFKINQEYASLDNNTIPEKLKFTLDALERNYSVKVKVGKKFSDNKSLDQDDENNIVIYAFDKKRVLTYRYIYNILNVLRHFAV